MSDRKGDPANQPDSCRINSAPPRCPDIECTHESFAGETWECKRCGERYRFHYEDMA
jgi:hypothetical protein